MRSDITAATKAATESNSTAPAYLVEIQWSTFSSHHCTYGTVSWNGSTWLGDGIALDSWSPDGTPTRIALADPTYTYRTLIAGDGVRDRRVSVWKADISALNLSDPIPLFAGYADGGEWANGHAIIYLDPSTASAQFVPRERIGPAAGVNFMAPQGFRLVWGSSILVFDARR